MRTFQFAVVRYVHDIATEEFANIGLVMFEPETGWLKHDLTTRYGRLSQFYREFAGDSYSHRVRRFARMVNARMKHVADQFARPELGADTNPELPAVLPKIFRGEDSCFQWSRVMTGVGVDLDAVVKHLTSRKGGRWRWPLRCEVVVKRRLSGSLHV